MSTTEFDQSDVFRDGGHEQGKPPGMFNDLDRPDVDEAGDRPAKKKGTLLPVVAGIGLVVIVAGFGVWKVVAPHLQSSQSSDDLGPISAPQIAQMAPAAPAPAGPMPGPAVAQQQAPQLPMGQGNTGSMPPLSPSTPGGAPQGGQQQPQGVGGALGTAAPAVIASSPGVAPVAAGSPPGGSPVQPTAPQTSGNADAGSASSPSHQATTDADFHALSARVDAIEESLKTISAQMEALKAKGVVNARADKPAPPSETHVARATERRHASTKHREPAKATTATPGDATTQGATGGDSSMRLKAVTEGRAWVQTKAGETVTVTMGDTVAPGVTVKSINADSGEVRLSNGNVLR
ncbi:hypothetical protein [Burkholderia cenocepacia]|uniref:hypothetical protein n=1 Tax=Burkholderia cenocepacia TaxID=95486 RepID=UPI000A3F4644|nr:hypothetical protein [Burkholderia cenocepacia]